MQSYLNLHGQQPDTSPAFVDNLSNTPNRDQPHESKIRMSSNNSGSNSAKNANVAIVKITTPKIVQPASNVGTWVFSGVISAVGLRL